MTIRRQKLGDRGESIASTYLESLGWNVIERNVHFRVAELDIVAFDEQELVFVEVRTLHRGRGIRAVDTVTRSKHRKLTLAARLYIQKTGLFSHVARFDVIGVDGRRGRVVDHIRSAFLA